MPEADDSLSFHSCHSALRELEVLQLLVHGHTYADVAGALGIAEGTVQTYVKRIYEKMDVSTKAEAALLAVARGLVRP